MDVKLVSIRELIGKISFEVALVSLSIGLERDFPVRTIDSNPVVYADIVITMMLPSVGRFFYNLYLRKAIINCNYWMDGQEGHNCDNILFQCRESCFNSSYRNSEDRLARQQDVDKLCECDVYRLDHFVNSQRNFLLDAPLRNKKTEGTPHQNLSWLGKISSGDLGVGSSTFLLRIRRQLCHALDSCPCHTPHKHQYLLVCPLCIIIGERVNALEMRDSVNDQPQPVSHGVIGHKQWSTRNNCQTIWKK